jgi:hypothetical protein
MKKYKTIKTSNKAVKSVTCNKCGRETVLDNAGSYNMGDEFESFTIKFGYGSKHDGERYMFDLCGDCLEKIFHSFKIPPETKEYCIVDDYKG